MNELQVDPTRRDLRVTGILVRALDGGRWVNADIAELSLDSLNEWLRSRGGDNRWAENTCALILGHTLGGEVGPRRLKT